MAGVSIRIEFLNRQAPSGNRYFVTMSILALSFQIIRIAATKNPNERSSKNVIIPTTPALHIDIFDNSGVVLTPT